MLDSLHRQLCRSQPKESHDPTTSLSRHRDDRPRCYHRHALGTSLRRRGGPVETLYFGLTEVSPFIADLTGFYERGIQHKGWSPQEEFDKYMEVCKDATMVAANPAHDKSFLLKNRLFPFHYRMLDIESYAKGKLGLDYVPSMRDIYSELSDRGYDIPRPDHSAEGDVVATRAACRVMESKSWL